MSLLAFARCVSSLKLENLRHLHADRPVTVRAAQRRLLFWMSGHILGFEVTLDDGRIVWRNVSV